LTLPEELALAAFPRTRLILADPAEAMLAQARKRLGQAEGKEADRSFSLRCCFHIVLRGKNAP